MWFKCLPLCGISSKETRSIIVEPGQGVTDAPIMADDVVCSAKMITAYFRNVYKIKIAIVELIVLFFPPSLILRYMIE